MSSPPPAAADDDVDGGLCGDRAAMAVGDGGILEGTAAVVQTEASRSDWLWRTAAAAVAVGVGAGAVLQCACVFQATQLLMQANC